MTKGQERTRLSPYMGKDYNVACYELASMGFEYYFHRPAELICDSDYFKFIAGLL